MVFGLFARRLRRWKSKRKQAQTTQLYPPNLTLQEIKAHKALFAEFDTDNSNSIDASEMKNVLQKLGRCLDEREVKEMIKSVDGNGNSVLEMREFLELMSQLKDSQPHHTCSAVEVQNLRWAFNEFDVDGSSSISYSELAPLLQFCGLNPVQYELNQLIKEVDLNRSGALDFPEFVILVDKVRQDQVDMKTILESFLILDKDGSGTLSVQELKDVLTTTGEVMTEEEVEELVELADADGNGFIDYKEFTALIMAGNSLPFEELPVDDPHIGIQQASPASSRGYSPLSDRPPSESKDEHPFQCNYD